MMFFIAQRPQNVNAYDSNLKCRCNVSTVWLYIIPQLSTMEKQAFPVVGV